MIAAIDRRIRAFRDAMTPGERWTAALALALATLVVGFGLPERVVFRPGGAASAGDYVTGEGNVLAPSPAEAPEASPLSTSAPSGVAEQHADAAATPAPESPGTPSSTSGAAPETPSDASSPASLLDLLPRTASTMVTSASQPTQQQMGVADGPCGQRVRTRANPRRGMPVHVFEPTGTSTAPTGGRCNASKRPAVFFAHGFGQSDPAGYEALIAHFVSRGNVVVYPTYDVSSGDRAALEESYRVVDAGIVAAVAATPRADTTRVGWWGHSHGGGMVPWLVQQGAARGWGRAARWMTIVAQAYTQLVGSGAISVPSNTQATVVAFEADQMADARLGVDVFESLTVTPSRRRYVLVRNDLHGQPPFVADHAA
ncbi:MAG TPA: hypothetical protein VNC60_03915, partial [Actinomycetota bacterium]|nr:hypothetical protein [Actinomycetota bacterium]